MGNEDFVDETVASPEHFSINAGSRTNLPAERVSRERLGSETASNPETSQPVSAPRYTGKNVDAIEAQEDLRAFARKHAVPDFISPFLLVVRS
jgi:hypothetical protein